MKTTQKPYLLKGTVAAGALAMLFMAAFPPMDAPTKPLANKCDTFVSASLREVTGSGSVNVITRLSGSGKLTASRKRELTQLGGEVYQELSLVKSVAVRVPKSSLARLTNLAWVERVSLDSEVKKSDEFTMGSSQAAAAFEQYRLDGSGVGVAVIDSGVRTHKDLNFANSTIFSRVIMSAYYGALFSNSYDYAGHGSHVAGIIAGNGSASSTADSYRTFYGIARNANIINVKVLGDEGQGTVAGVIAGINWIITNKNTFNIRVINLSLGHPVGESYTTDPLCQAVEAAWNAGIVVVCAAGNDGRLNTAPVAGADNEGFGSNYGSIQSPANDPLVITVGAMKAGAGGRASDKIATYSARGPSRFDYVLKPDIVAPGNRVISLNSYGSYLQTTYATANIVPYSAYRTNGSDAQSRYFYLSGTSMAAPVVAGAGSRHIAAGPAPRFPLDHQHGR